MLSCVSVTLLMLKSMDDFTDTQVLTLCLTEFVDHA